MASKVVKQLVKQKKEIADGYLAEDYDGRQRFVLVSLSRGSSSSALAEVLVEKTASLESGAKVKVKTVNGKVYIVSFGGRLDRLCEDFDRISDEVILDHQNITEEEVFPVWGFDDVLVTTGFPVVESFSEDHDGTSYTFTVPSGVVVGDILIALLNVHWTGGTGTGVTWPSEWVQFISTYYGVVDGLGLAAYKIADGTEGSTYTVTPDVAAQLIMQTYRISNASAVAGASIHQGFAQGDPPSLTSGFGAADTLWLAVDWYANVGVGTTGYPASYTNGVTNVASPTSNPATIDSARRFLNAATEDPGAFTQTGNPWMCSGTIAVLGGASVRQENDIKPDINWEGITGQAGAKFGIDSDGAYIGGKVNAGAHIEDYSITIDYPCTFYLRTKFNIARPGALYYQVFFFLTGDDSSYTDNDSFPYSTYPDKDDYGSTLSFYISVGVTDTTMSVTANRQQGNPAQYDSTPIVIAHDPNDWAWYAFDFVPGESISIRTWPDTDVEAEEPILTLLAEEDDIYIPRVLYRYELGQYTAVFDIGNANNKVWFSDFCAVSDNVTEAPGSPNPIRYGVAENGTTYPYTPAGDQCAIGPPTNIGGNWVFTATALKSYWRAGQGASNYPDVVTTGDWGNGGVGNCVGTANDIDYCGGGVAVYAKLRFIGPGTATIYVYPNTFGVSCTNNQSITASAAKSFNDAAVDSDTQTVGSGIPLTITIPDNGTLAHYVHLNSAAGSWGLGCVNWTPLDVDDG